MKTSHFLLHWQQSESSGIGNSQQHEEQVHREKLVDNSIRHGWSLFLPSKKVRIKDYPPHRHRDIFSSWKGFQLS
jgi:hypothetical protein